jgi:hypothetical protein
VFTILCSNAGLLMAMEMSNTVNIESLPPQLANKAVIAAFANLQIEALKLQRLSLVGMVIY